MGLIGRAATHPGPQSRFLEPRRATPAVVIPSLTWWPMIEAVRVMEVPLALT